MYQLTLSHFPPLNISTPIVLDGIHLRDFLAATFQTSPHGLMHPTSTSNYAENGTCEKLAADLQLHILSKTASGSSRSTSGTLRFDGSGQSAASDGMCNSPLPHSLTCAKTPKTCREEMSLDPHETLFRGAAEKRVAAVLRFGSESLHDTD